MAWGQKALLLCVFIGLGTASASAEDGYDLWLRYQPLPRAEQVRLAPYARTVCAEAPGPSARVALAELSRGLSGFLGRRPLFKHHVDKSCGIVLGRSGAVKDLGPEGFRLFSQNGGGHVAIRIQANSEKGQLYGAFRLLQRLQAGDDPARLNIHAVPKLSLRILNHWDNLDGRVERGYAGQSLWQWAELPQRLAPRYTDYARANASIGINGVVLNNVNAKAQSLTADYIAKTAALADVFRPYGIKVYLSARFSAPRELGGLPTADPLDPQVQNWWRSKADEIYRAIPDFGGFLVKANSEGQPGPQDYGRNHADGANLLARAVKPHGGIVMYRAFVYAHDRPMDRARQAYADFMPLDGQFDDNVTVQVKNGPIDFQPREPFHPLIGGMKKTPLMMEVQVSKEYLGFATHLVYLGPLFSEALQSDTHRNSRGSTVARSLTASGPMAGMAGVANTGSDRNWTGSIFNQANWFAYGRLSWDPDASSEAIAREWLTFTFTRDPKFVEPVLSMMMQSREAAVDYMTPLGLAHQMGTDHHYGPAPWVSTLSRPEWNPVYYAQADGQGIGFDRTVTGSKALDDYAPKLIQRWSNPRTTPDKLLLWFHHLPWDWRMRSGRTLWDDFVLHYDRGVRQVEAMQRVWRAQQGRVDPERFALTRDYLAIQQKEARWWRDASIAWFASKSKRPLPRGVAPPAHPLEYYQALAFKGVPGTPQ